MKYTYQLNPVEKALNAAYTLEELQELTTLQLREICYKEKLVIGVAYKLNRVYLINTILKYRGAKLFTFIDKFVVESFELVVNKFAKMLNLIEEHEEIQIPTRITLYKKIETTINDNYIIKGERLSEGNVLLFNENRQISGILNLIKSNKEYYLICKNELLDSSIPEAMYKNYFLGFIDEKSSRYLYNYYYSGKMMPTKINCYLVNISELLIIDTQAAHTSLVIDFGTSNSAAGSYLGEHHIGNNLKQDLQKNGVALNKINKTRFVNTLSKTNVLSEILPSVVGIKDCSDSAQIVYRFGYDALKNARKNSYNNPATVFYGIKKWINDYNKIEEIADENGNIAYITRKNILKSYFDYIISVSEQQHKCSYKSLHITSPVKQKFQFLEMYKEILPEYEIIVDTALDEGIAVLYNSISNQIENNRFEDGKDYCALIIDCGGGTTDLTSCTYFIEDNQITYCLNLTTTYANGETNFGGNNITFRIFQYLKILFTKYYANEEKINMEDIFEIDLSDIYRNVDKSTIDDIYKNFELIYDSCEKIIPTKFFNYKNNPTEDYIKVKSNFYFLWNLAEKIKIELFQTTSEMQTNFHKCGLKTDLADPKILAEESWRLNIYQNSKRHNLNRNITNEHKKLTLTTDFPEVIITKEEITLLTKAEIYSVIKKFIEPLFLNGELDQFNFIKLTGQTCKIDIFRDALKEFIPGRFIESSRKEKAVQDFKLTCLEGAVKYQNARKIGLIAPVIKNKAPITPYKLVSYTHSGSEVIMISSLEEITKSYGFVSRNIDTEDIEMILMDAGNKILHKYPFITNIKDFRSTTYEETTREYSEKILQDDIDSIIDGEIKIFTFAFLDKWGFYILPLARKNGTLLIGERKYMPFENDEWELNFFDGQK